MRYFSLSFSQIVRPALLCVLITRRFTFNKQIIIHVMTSQFGLIGTFE